MLSIIIPTFNEQSIIELIVEEIRSALLEKIQYELVIVDDSYDDTPRRLEALSKKYANLVFCHRDKARGIASAVVLGFSLASGEVLAVMDADLQHPPQLLPLMYSLIMEGADIVIPSRYIGEGGNEVMSPLRRNASLAARWVSRLVLKPLRKVSDPTGGFFMMRREVIEGVHMKPIGWRVQMEVLTLGKYSNVVEIPYTFQKRGAGHSKLGVKAAVQDFLHLLMLAVKHKNAGKAKINYSVYQNGRIVSEGK